MKALTIFLVLSMYFFITGVQAQNPRINLLEDQTFTSCGSCPCLDSIVRTCIIPRVPNSVFVRYHFSYSKFYSENCDSLMQKLLDNGTKLSVNRNGLVFTEPQFAKHYYQFCDSVVDVLNKDVTAPVKILLKSKAYNEQSRGLAFAVDFTPYQADLSGTFMVNVVITENRLLAQQTFHDSCGKPTEGDFDILHFNVARQMAYYPYADTLVSGQWPQTKTVSRDFSITLDPRWVPSNCEFTVYVYKQEDSLCKSKVQQALRQSVVWPVGVNQLNRPSGDIKVIPSPASGLVNAHIPFMESGVANISILNQKGQIVEKFPSVRIEPETYNLEFDVSAYSPGLYFLKVDLNGKAINQKFTVVH